MDLKSIREAYEKIKWPEGTCLVVVAGSHAYGMETEESDLDLRGVFLNSAENILCEAPADTIIMKSEDIVLHPLNKFCRLASAGNPNVLEWLFVKEEHILFCDEAGKEILKHRKDFLSQKMIVSYSGFVKHSWKELNEKLRKDDLDDSQVYKLEKQTRHILRLSMQLLEALQTGQFHTWTGKLQNGLYRDPESGRWEISEFYKASLKDIWDKIEKSKESTSLPKEPVWDNINELIIRLNLNTVLAWDQMTS